MATKNTNNEAAPNRAQNGQYLHTFEKVCTCGHTNGDHDAERATVAGEAFQYCNLCACSCFTKARRGGGPAAK